MNDRTKRKAPSSCGGGRPCGAEDDESATPANDDSGGQTTSNIASSTSTTNKTRTKNNPHHQISSSSKSHGNSTSNSYLRDQEQSEHSEDDDEQNHNKQKPLAAPPATNNPRSTGDDAGAVHRREKKHERRCNSSSVTSSNKPAGNHMNKKAKLTSAADTRDVNIHISPPRPNSCATEDGAHSSSTRNFTSGEAGKGLGRKGDPRMHRAVAAKLEDPSISLLDALIKGGFRFPSISSSTATKKNNSNDPNQDHLSSSTSDLANAKSEREIFDEDGVQMSQRKNQLGRRLRILRKKGDENDHADEEECEDGNSNARGSTSLHKDSELIKNVLLSLPPTGVENSSIGSQREGPLALKAISQSSVPALPHGSLMNDLNSNRRINLLQGLQQNTSNIPATVNSGPNRTDLLQTISSTLNHDFTNLTRNTNRNFANQSSLSSQEKDETNHTQNTLLQKLLIEQNSSPLLQLLNLQNPTINFNNNNDGIGRRNTFAQSGSGLNVTSTEPPMMNSLNLLPQQIQALGRGEMMNQGISNQSEIWQKLLLLLQEYQSAQNPSHNVSNPSSSSSLDNNTYTFPSLMPNSNIQKQQQQQQPNIIVDKSKLQAAIELYTTQNRSLIINSLLQAGFTVHELLRNNAELLLYLEKELLNAVNDADKL